jgi:hypothetical protein
MGKSRVILEPGVVPKPNDPCPICERSHRSERRFRVCIVEREFTEWIDYCCSMPRGSGIGLVEHYGRFLNHVYPAWYWNSIAWAIRVRDGKKCQQCGRQCFCEVHHIKPRSRGGLDNPDNLISLCQDCHKGYTSCLVKKKVKGGEVLMNPVMPVQETLTDSIFR